MEQLFSHKVKKEEQPIARESIKIKQVKER